MKKELPKYSTEYFFEKKNKYALLIPTINEGDRIQKQLKQLKKLNISNIIDIFILDSNSTDNSLNSDFLQNINVRLKVNILEGKQGSAFRAGINEALQEGYEGIITVDGNNKDNMSAIINFIEKLEDGYDFIQGSRYIQGGKHENTPLIRILATKYILTPWINILAKYKYTETSSAFRGYSKKILTSANLFRKCFVSYEFLWYMSVFAAKNNFKIIEIPTERIYPKGIKATKINVLGYFQIIFQLICLTFKKYN